MDWEIVFIYVLGLLMFGGTIVLGITTVRIMWRSMHGKTVKKREIKLAGNSFGVVFATALFLTLFMLVYQQSLFAFFLSFIGAIITWVVLNIVYQKLMEGFVVNYTEAYNKMHSDDLA